MDPRTLVSVFFAITWLALLSFWYLQNTNMLFSLSSANRSYPQSVCFTALFLQTAVDELDQRLKKRYDRLSAVLAIFDLSKVLYNVNIVRVYPELDHQLDDWNDGDLPPRDSSNRGGGEDDNDDGDPPPRYSSVRGGGEDDSDDGDLPPRDSSVRGGGEYDSDDSDPPGASWREEPWDISDRDEGGFDIGAPSRDISDRGGGEDDSDDGDPPPRDSSDRGGGEDDSDDGDPPPRDSSDRGGGGLRHFFSSFWWHQENTRLSTSTAANRPSTSTAANQPSTSTAAYQPSSLTAANRPSTSTAAYQPSSLTAANRPSTSTAANQPSTSTAAYQPSSLTAANRPSTSTAANQPSTSTAANQPSTSTAAYQPSTSTAANQPSTSTAANQPSTSTAAYQPSTAVSQSSSESNGQCLICFQPFTRDHCVATLRCGHLFGKLCIERWIGQEKKNCPLCLKPASLSEIIPLFVKCLNVLDNAELHELRRINAALTEENTRLRDMLSRANNESREPNVADDESKEHNEADEESHKENGADEKM